MRLMEPPYLSTHTMSASLGFINNGNHAIAARSALSVEVGDDASSLTRRDRSARTVVASDEPLLDIMGARLRMLNAAMALFHTALFAVTIGIGNRDLAVPLWKPELEFVQRAEGEDGPAFQLIPTFVAAFDVPFTWLVASFFAVSAIAHLGNALLWRAFYERELARCRVPTRWTEYFFSATIMVVGLAYTTGIRSYLLLGCIGALIATTMIFGHLCELIATPKSADEWDRPLSVRLQAHVLGYIPQVAAWTAILLNFFLAPSAEEGQGPPDFVYLIVYLQVALFFSFGIVQLVQQCLPPKRYPAGEVAYQWLSLGSKGVLGGILLTNVLVLGSFEELFEE